MDIAGVPVQLGLLPIRVAVSGQNRYLLAFPGEIVGRANLLGSDLAVEGVTKGNSQEIIFFLIPSKPGGI